MNLQYEFKMKHGTNRYTLVVNEIIQYYFNNNSNMYLTLIDASKVFDSVRYITLFKLLLSRKICTLIARFLTTQSF